MWSITMHYLQLYFIHGIVETPNNATFVFRYATSVGSRREVNKLPNNKVDFILICVVIFN